MSKNKYEICQRNSDGTWNTIAQSDVYNYASKILNALEFLDGKEYAIYQNGKKLVDVRVATA